VFEVIVCSKDNDEASFKNSTEGTPFLAIPFDSEKREGTSSKYAVPGIPTLTIVRENGEVLELEGDMQIGKGMEAITTWKAA